MLLDSSLLVLNLAKLLAFVEIGSVFRYHFSFTSELCYLFLLFLLLFLDDDEVVEDVAVTCFVDSMAAAVQG